MNIEFFELSHMNEPEHYWFIYLNKLSEREGFSTSEDQPESSSFFLPAVSTHHKEFTNWLKAAALDAIMVGLQTQEKKLALRCYAQSCEYLGRMKSFQYSDEFAGYRRQLEDAHHHLRNKVEKMMGD